MWDNIFNIFQTKSTPSSLNLNSADPEQDGFQRFMEEYAEQQRTNLGVVRNGIHGTTHQRVPLHAVGNEDCRLRVVWRFYKWLYPHSAWASRVPLSNAARLDEHNFGRSA
jgi:hypothetical protein